MSGLLLAAAVGAAAATGTAVAGVVRQEARARLEKVPAALLDLACRRLPDHIREELSQEWRAELAAILREREAMPISRLCRALAFSLGLLRAGPRIARELGHGTPTAGEKSAAIATFTSALDATAHHAHRSTQAALRQGLLHGASGKCALCGKTLPRPFLIAAHIKKRALCSGEEKRDLANIAMLLCTFGCDALYEHGYITVGAGGLLQVSPLVDTMPHIAAYINDALTGRTIEWWSEDREAYYRWHRTHIFNDGAPL